MCPMTAQLGIIAENKGTFCLKKIQFFIMMHIITCSFLKIRLPSIIQYLLFVTNTYIALNVVLPNMVANEHFSQSVYMLSELDR